MRIWTAIGILALGGGALRADNVYVVDQYNNSVIIFDGVAMTLVTTLTNLVPGIANATIPGVQPPYNKAGGPCKVVVTPDAKWAFVSNFKNAATGLPATLDSVTAINAATLATTLIPIPAGGSGCFVPVASPDSQKIYVPMSAATGYQVVQIDVASLAVTATIPVGGKPGVMDVSADNKQLLVPHDQQVDVLDISAIAGAASEARSRAESPRTICCSTTTFDLPGATVDVLNAPPAGIMVEVKAAGLIGTYRQRPDGTFSRIYLSGSGSGAATPRITIKYDSETEILTIQVDPGDGIVSFIEMSTKSGKVTMSGQFTYQPPPAPAPHVRASSGKPVFYEWLATAVSADGSLLYGYGLGFPLSVQSISSWDLTNRSASGVVPMVGALPLPNASSPSMITDMATTSPPHLVDQSIVITPASASITSGQSTPLSTAVAHSVTEAAPYGDPNSVTWSLAAMDSTCSNPSGTANGASLSTTGPAATSTLISPSGIPANQTVTVYACRPNPGGIFDPSVTQTDITVTPLISLSIAPASVTLTAGQTQQFAATVTNSPAVATFSVASGPGSVDPNSGVYTAPAAIASPASATVRASQALATPPIADAAVTLVPPTSVSFQTSPAGLQFSVDGGTPQAAPATLTVGQTTHTISVQPVQPGTAGTQYVFTGWNDHGDASHVITAAAAPATYTASFKTQYQLTTLAAPAVGGSVTPASGGYYDSGSVVNLNATANGGYVFSGWTGAVASNTVTMSAPETVTAGFTVNPCDVNLDASTDINDVQRMLKEALGLAVPADDLAHGGAVGVVGVQIDLNAARGFGCAAN